MFAIFQTALRWSIGLWVVALPTTAFSQLPGGTSIAAIDYESGQVAIIARSLHRFIGANPDPGKNVWKKAEQACRRIDKDATPLLSGAQRGGHDRMMFTFRCIPNSPEASQHPTGRGSERIAA